MFSDEVLERIFSHTETNEIPMDHQSIMINVIEQVLEEMGVDTNATVSES